MNNAAVSVSYLDYIMLELAENGKAYFASDYGYSIDDVRDAAKEDGVQVRIKETACGSYLVTLRKVGLGH
jgi:hypothetical protein